MNNFHERGCPLATAHFSSVRPCHVELPRFVKPTRRSDPRRFELLATATSWRSGDEFAVSRGCAFMEHKSVSIGWCLNQLTNLWTFECRLQIRIDWDP
eukprot:s857_g8.t1